MVCRTHQHEMTEVQFVEKHKHDWIALQALARRPRDVREFARLFRLASHHLAYAKTHYPHSSTVVYLNQVVSTAHNAFFVRKRGGFFTITQYFAYDFPKLVRDIWQYWAIAAALFFVAVFFAAGYVAALPERLNDIGPWNIDTTITPDFGDGSFDVNYPIITALIATNNIRVAINAFAWGILAGIGTVYIILYNGLIVGGLFGFLHQSGADMVMAYALVLPHGVLELFAIFLCGGCGLMLGKGLLIPGEHTRLQSLGIHAKKAVALMPGIITMLAIAAVIEGFFTPAAIDPVIKLVFAVLSGVVFIVYVLRNSGSRG